MGELLQKRTRFCKNTPLTTTWTFCKFPPDYIKKPAWQLMFFSYRAGFDLFRTEPYGLFNISGQPLILHRFYMTLITDFTYAC